MDLNYEVLQADFVLTIGSAGGRDSLGRDGYWRRKESILVPGTSRTRNCRHLEIQDSNIQVSCPKTTNTVDGSSDFYTFEHEISLGDIR